ncbi:hypothetical protein [Hydrogenivirga sp. 128-5-R1-1]|uniref:hypothetical protein n=1 Tax=Hydrogenivirga sp. 128-5-R1-1 TaxID=392423 RepID=UPI00015EF192|nr:hypothetical protein [Hydrogenivirga sp. 128-5-R1-1]EDP74720.1 hypothetical protein HG1285_14949 [Hydrogenivirga sp. 128-5-R1-1]
MNWRVSINIVPLLGAFILITACGGGGGGGGGTASPTYAVGGTISGLSGTLVLQNNGGDDLSVSTSGSFTFSTTLTDGSAYNVTILTQPTGQTCYIKNGSGTVSGSDVTNVNVNCYDSGSLDTSFNSKGFVTHHNAAGGNGRDNGKAITTDDQGRILVAGQSHNGSDFDLSLWRYNPDGTLDTSFGTKGFVTHHDAAGGGGSDRVYSITTDNQGKILVTGESDNGSDMDMVIWRFHPDGTLDTTFGTGGVVVHHNAAGGNGGDTGRSIAIDSQGRILVTGHSRNGSGNDDMVIWRYNPDGTIDSAFGNNGVVVHNSAAGGNGSDLGNSITIDGQGRILVTGESSNGSNDDMVIWRYDIFGNLDASFGTGGVVVHHNAAGGDGNDLGKSITIDNQGRVLVAGHSQNGSDYDMVVWRYNPDGTLDTSFGNNGFVVHHNAAGGNNHDYGRSIVIDKQKRILIGGSSFNTSDEDMVVWRYNPDGTLDTSFGNNGIVIHNSAAGGNNHDYARSITMDDDGKILVTGDSYNGSNYDMVIWRFIP